jgi:hypothetical protein
VTKCQTISGTLRSCQFWSLKCECKVTFQNSAPNVCIALHDGCVRAAIGRATTLDHSPPNRANSAFAVRLNVATKNNRLRMRRELMSWKRESLSKQSWGHTRRKGQRERRCRIKAEVKRNQECRCRDEGELLGRNEFDRCRQKRGGLPQLAGASSSCVRECGRCGQ